MIDILRGAVGVVFAFSFAIFIHELGHYAFAKLFKVRVETFSIGFGKKIWRRKWGETEYAIGTVPFGGYVKLVGMHSKEMEDLLAGDPAAKSGETAEGDPNAPRTGMAGEEGKTAAEAQQEAFDPGAAQRAPMAALGASVAEEVAALRNKNWLQKFLIFAAGCINNLITAVIVFFLMIWIGYHRAPKSSPELDMVKPLAEERAGLQKGDRLAAVAGKPVDSYDEFVEAYLKFAEENPSAAVAPVEIVREGTTTPLEIPLQAVAGFPPAGRKIVQVGTKEVASAPKAARAAMELEDRGTTSVAVVTEGPDGGRTTHQVAVAAAMGPHWLYDEIRPFAPAYISMPLPNLPAERAGMRMGDLIVSVNGKPVRTADEARDMLRSLPDRRVPVEVKRVEEIVRLDIDVRTDPDNPQVGQIGVAFDAPPTDFYKKPAGEAFQEAVQRVGRTALFYFRAIRDLLQQSFQTIRENVGGPIQIGTMFYKAANQGVVWFLELFALFNIILAVTNLLPLPVFDGGHIVIATIEAIIRRPLPAKVMVHVFNVFVILIIGLALLVTFNDIIMNAWRLR